MALKVKDKNNQELVETLTGEGGPLQSGVVPGLEAHTEAGQKALAESICSAGMEVVKKKVKDKKDKSAEPAEPKTFLEFGAQWSGG